MDESLSKTLLARLCAAFMVLAGLLGFVRSLLSSQPGIDHAALVQVSLAAATVGAIAWVMPWERWPRQALFSLVAAALVLKALGNWAGDAGAHLYVVHYAVLFMWVGLALPRGSALACAPFFALSYVAPMWYLGRPSADIASVAIVAPACVFVGEAASWLTARLRQAESVSQERATQMAGLVESTLALAASHDVARLAYLTALGAADLFRGPRAVVFLESDTGSLERVGDVRWLGDDEATAALGAAAERALRGPDESEPEDDALAELARELDVGALELVPIQGSGKPFGAVVVVVPEVGSVHDDFSRYATRTFATQAGLGFERVRRAEALKDASLRDALTGVGNRRKAMGALELLQENDAVVMIDLDHFKGVNDNFGHAAGDRVLRTLGAFLRSSVRVPDEVFRFGGEEFLLVLAGGSGGAFAAVERIHVGWGAQQRVTSFSAGVAVHRRDETPDRTVARADAALYAAKRAGRDRVVLYEPGHEDPEEEAKSA